MRYVLTSGILAAALALGAAVGCEETPPPPKPTKPAKKPTKPAKTAEKPKIKKLTPQQKVALIKKCWAAWDANDEKTFGECYSDKTAFEMIDHLPPMRSRGLKASFAATAPLRKAFPDIKHELGMIFVRANDAVVVYSMHATNKGELMGKEATDKPVGYVSAHHVRFGPDGKASMDHHFGDQSTMMGQLGMHDNPVRPVREAGKWGETQVIISKNDKKEKDNLAKFRELGKAMESKEIDKIMEFYADDAVFSYMAGKEDAKGKAAIKKSMDMWLKASTDCKDTMAWTWAAGDYVLAEGKSTGTNDGPLMAGKPATNKKFNMRELMIVKFEEGKVKEHMMFTNGYKFAVDLGLAPPPGEEVAEKKDEKAEDKDKPKPAPKDKAAGAKPEAPKPSTPKKE